MKVRIFFLLALSLLTLFLQVVITGVSWGLSRLLRALSKPHVTFDSEFPNGHTLQLMQRLAQRFSYHDSLASLVEDGKVDEESVQRNRPLYEKLLFAPEALELSKFKSALITLSNCCMNNASSCKKSMQQICKFFKEEESSAWIKQVAKHHQDLRLMDLTDQFKTQTIQVCNSFTAAELVDLSVLAFLSSKTKALTALSGDPSLSKLDNILKRDFIRPFLKFANHPLIGRSDPAIRLLLQQLRRTFEERTGANQLLLVSTVLEMLAGKLGRPLLELYLRALSLDAVIRAPLELYQNFEKLSAHERHIMANGIAELALMNSLVASLSAGGGKEQSSVMPPPIPASLEPLQCHPVYGKLCFLLTSNLPARMTAISRVYLQRQLIQRQIGQ